MAVIRCETCGANLDIDPKHFGVSVRCGQCKSVFSSPPSPLIARAIPIATVLSVPQSLSEPTETEAQQREEKDDLTLLAAEEKVATVGLAMSTIAAFAMMVFLIVFVLSIASIFTEPNKKEESIVAVVLCAVGFSYFFMIGYAGWQMQLLRKPTAVYIGLMMCLCIGPLFITLVVMLWGFLVMSDPIVQRGFHIRAARERKGR